MIDDQNTRHQITIYRRSERVSDQPDCVLRIPFILSGYLRAVHAYKQREDQGCGLLLLPAINNSSLVDSYN